MKLKVTSIWFSDNISPWRALSMTEYLRCKDTSPRFGYVREMFYTKLIDLRRSEENILASFAAETRRLVRRADKEGIVYDTAMNMEEFVQFFNRFAKQKNLSYWLNLETIREKAKNYKITRAMKDGHVLFAHLYLCDDTTRRAILLYGGSILKDENHQISNGVINSGNRGLHYYDMRILKASGYESYDMCGYAPDTQDHELRKINDFKDEFGGEVICEANFRSFVMQATSTIFNFFVIGSQKQPVRKVISFFSRASRAG